MYRNEAVCLLTFVGKRFRMLSESYINWRQCLALPLSLDSNDENGFMATTRTRLLRRDKDMHIYMPLNWRQGTSYQLTRYIHDRWC